MLRVILVILIVTICMGNKALAAMFSLPVNGDSVVGAVRYKVIHEHETLLDIARQYDLGLNEIIAANPGINPWVPSKNYRVVIPTFFVLPSKPWKGIIVNLPEMRLYYFPPESIFNERRVITMPLSIGKINWQTPVGEFYIKEKIKHPSWTVPQSIVSEYGLERYGNRRLIPPGDEDNPLGHHAILLNEAGYLIHGTNKPYSIGLRVSHGCIRLYPEDIDVLFDYVERNTSVRIINQPNKVGKRGPTLYVETHAILKEDADKNGSNITPVINAVVRHMPESMVPEFVWHQLDNIVSNASGLPAPLLDLLDYADSSTGSKQSAVKFSRY